MPTIVPQHPLNTVLRFGKVDENASTAKLGEYFRQFDKGTDKVVFISANDDKPETPVNQSQKRVKSGRFNLVLVGLLALMAPFGLVGSRHYQGLKPSPTTVAQNKILAPDWNNLVNVVKSAEGKLDDSQKKGEFSRAVVVFMTGILQTLEQHPTDELSKQLLTELRAEMESNADFAPFLAANRVSKDLFSYLYDEIKLPQNPSERQLDNYLANLKEDFTNKTQELKHLSEAEKDQFTVDVKAVIRKVGSSPVFPNHFIPTVSGHLADGAGRATLSQFSTVQTEADAIKLFTTIVDNTKNFTKLSPADRKALREHGVKALESIEYSSPSPLYGLLTYALLGLGMIGAPGVAFLRRKELLGLPQAKKDLAKALENPVLIVNNVEEGDVEGRRKVARLNENIDKRATDIAGILRTVYGENKEVKGFLLELFGSEKELPDARWFKQLFMYNAAQDILQSRTPAQKLNEEPVTRTQMMEKANAKIEEGYETGEFLWIDPALTQQLGQVDSKLSDEANLQQERQRIDNLITMAMKSYANRMFGEAQVKQRVATMEAEAAELKQLFTTLGQQHQATAQPDVKDAAGALPANLVELHGQMKAFQAELGTAKKRQEDAALLAEEARNLLTDYVQPLREYRARLSETLAQGQFTKSIEELRQIKGVSGEIKEDPKLQQALDEQKLEEILLKDEQRNREIRERVQARVAQQIQALETEKTIAGAKSA